MNREYLFCGFEWDESGSREITLNGNKIKGEWVEGWYVGKTCDTMFSPARESAQIIDDNLMWHEVIPKTVREYIGQKDKKGNKIFEGSLLKDKYSNYIVGWDKVASLYYLSTGSVWVSAEDSGKMELIGNKYETPEEKEE